VVCNPADDAKLARLVRLLRLERGARVIDIASGKGEFLVRLAEAYGVSAIGVDISPFTVADATRRAAGRVPGADVKFVQMDGAHYRPGRPREFRAASCIGASWVFGGHRGTLEALIGLTEPGGWVIAGEPFWLREPAAEYLEAIGERREAFGSHAGNVETGERLGLHLVHTLVSSPDDWDVYEGLQWYAAEQYARAHPDDPDVPELTARVALQKAAYLRWGRDTVGWAIYLFRAP
jgi:SAM-dependent methyltransferase